MLPLTTSFTEERRKIGEKIQLGTHLVLAIVKTVEKKGKKKTKKRKGVREHARTTSDENVTSFNYTERMLQALLKPGRGGTHL